MSDLLQTFDFSDFVLEVIEREGQPWFIARPLALFLGYQNPAEALKYNCDQGEIDTIYIPTKSNNYVCVNESGLYSLVIRSNKPEAKKFKRWVTHEVLPSIRKHGYYAKPKPLYDDTHEESTLPLHRVQSALLGELRRMSKSLAQVYLLECGVTPAYVSRQLDLLDGKVLIGLDHDQDNAMPVEFLKNDVANQADHTDGNYFYFLAATFRKMCGDYDPLATARQLRDKKLLKHYRHTLTIRMQLPKPGHNKRTRLYAISQAILEV